jgi:hypothetical protein
VLPRSLAAYRIIFFVLFRIEFINYAKYILCTRKKSIAHSQKIFHSLLLAAAAAGAERKTEEIIFVHVTAPLS